jgi:hypothetical protein
MTSNRLLHALIFHTWKDTLTPTNRANWQAAALTVSIENYRGVAKVPNGYELFTWHHTLNSVTAYPSGLPFNWPGITFQPDPPSPYVLPAAPHISGLNSSTPTSFQLALDNWPEDGHQVCLTSIQRLSIPEGKKGKGKKFTGATADGNGTSGTGSMDVYPLYPYPAPATGTVLRVGIRYRIEGSGSQVQPPSTAVSLTPPTINPWTNPTNVFVSDGLYASCPMTSLPFQNTTTTDTLRATGFAFTIPPSATIKGIKYRLQVRDTLSHTAYCYLNLTAFGFVASAVYLLNGDWPTSEAFIEHGDDTDLWSGSWTPATINDPSFGADVVAAATRRGEPPATPFTSLPEIDFIELTVYYTLGKRIPSNPTFYDWTRPA